MGPHVRCVGQVLPQQGVDYGYVIMMITILLYL
jgi:hypothetical protein